MSSPSSVRIGLVGCDTSHATEFAARINDPRHPGHVPGGRVVAALPSTSPDMPWSRDRAAGFVETLKNQHGVELVAGMDRLLSCCEAVLLCSLDGRRHPAQVEPVLEAGLPVFLDKPVAGSLKDVEAIYERAARLMTPLFSSSLLRWHPGVVSLTEAPVGAVRAAWSCGPSPLEPSHPDLFFYGIHPTEALFTLLGPTCEQVSRVASDHVSLVTGRWADGSLGTVQALHRWPAPYRLAKFGDEAVLEQSLEVGDYTPLVAQIMRFFTTRHAPVSAEETLAIYRFMEAADESKRRGGAVVKLRKPG